MCKYYSDIIAVSKHGFIIYIKINIRKQTESRLNHAQLTETEVATSTRRGSIWSNI